MPVNTYEAMFVLDSSKVAVNWDESVEQVHGILTKHQAEVVASRQWDERRLAYPINGQKKGTFLLTFFRSEGAAIREIEADCRLNELVLRDLILKVQPKLADHLISQAMSSNPHEEDGPPPRDRDRDRDRDDDDRPRRRGRRDDRE